MTVKILPINYLLQVLVATGLFFSTGEVHSQIPASSTKRKHADNFNLIYPNNREGLKEGAGLIAHIGERLVSIEKGIKHLGDSISYLFNKANQLIERRVYNNEGKPKETTTWHFDAKGNMISMEAISHDGGTPFSIQFSYNSLGQVVSTITRYDAGYENETYQYDGSNYLTGKKTLDKKGNVWETTRYSYDKRGNLLSIISRSVKGDTLSFSKYVYNNLDQCIQREHYGQPINCAGRNVWRLKYNPVGDIADEQSHDIRIRHHYQYDGRNNWTKRVQYYDDETDANFLVSRRITYRN
jgi:hypothetical protein